jgi:hypothetical protein
MRIKIIGDNNCARATRHLLRKAGFAVTEFLPADVVTRAPHSGYVITIDLAPAPHTPNPTSKPDHSTPVYAEATAGRYTANHGEALPSHGGASSPTSHGGAGILPAGLHTGHMENRRRDAGATGSASILFDSVDSELEGAILRHVTQLAAAPVVVDRPGGVVHSERELRIVVPNSGDVKADEADAVAVEFGVLRGLLDLISPPSLPKMRGPSAGLPSGAPGVLPSAGRKKWWAFFLQATLPASRRPNRARTHFWRGAFAALALAGSLHASPRRVAIKPARVIQERRADRGAFLPAAALAAQGQFATGQAPMKITDGTNNLVVDPCKGQTKLYVSINQTANAQLVAGTASKKIYICSIHVVVAVSTNAALVEGTGSVCATGTAGVGGFGGATAATGWNFAANGGIAFGNGDAAVGAEGTNADNLCLFNSGSGQVSGGISYVVQ